jgi:hypothetical protein
MTDANTIIAPIRPVGGPRQASLELRGTVLVYHQHGWAGSASVFIPVEWVAVSSRFRYNTNYLFGVLLAGALLISLSSAVTVDITRGAYAHAAGVAVPALMCLIVNLYCLYRMLQRGRTTILSVESEPRMMRIEFWHVPSQDALLDALLDRLNSLRDRIEEIAPYPIQTSHTWYRLRPLRAVLAKGLLFSVILYVPVSILAGYLEMPGLVFFLLVPPIFYGGQYALVALRSLSSPKSFRAAVKSYNRGEVGEADSLVSDALAAYPDHPESLMLSVYVKVEQRQFDRAFDQCRKLAAVDQAHADDLVKEVWAIKRMYDRMELET